MAEIPLINFVNFTFCRFYVKMSKTTHFMSENHLVTGHSVYYYVSAMYGRRVAGRTALNRGKQVLHWHMGTTLPDM